MLEFYRPRVVYIFYHFMGVGFGNFCIVDNICGQKGLRRRNKSLLLLRDLLSPINFIHGAFIVDNSPNDGLLWCLESKRGGSFCAVSRHGNLVQVIKILFSFLINDSGISV
jgi:hypothetical protein